MQELNAATLSNFEELLLSIKNEYNRNHIQYPLLDSIKIPINVYVTHQQYVFWDVVSRYLPLGSKLSKAYISPNDHALKGLQMLRDVSRFFDFSTVLSSRNHINDTSLPPSHNPNDFFSTTRVRRSSEGVESTSSTISKTHPHLNGKFESYYLYQFDYNLIKSELSKHGILWSLPSDDDNQKGLRLSISVLDITQNKARLLSMLRSIVSNNDSLNVSSIELVDDEIIVLFASSDVSMNSYEFGILNTGSNSNVVDCFSERTLRIIYNNLNSNGHGDLDDAVGRQFVKGFPNSVRKKGTALARAIQDSLIEVLGGSNGVISVLQGRTNEYIVSIVNGILASNEVLYDEIDRLGGGDVKSKARKAFESGMNKTAISKQVAMLLNNGMDINKTTGKTMISGSWTDQDSRNTQVLQKDLDLARSRKRNTPSPTSL